MCTSEPSSSLYACLKASELGVSKSLTKLSSNTQYRICCSSYPLSSHTFPFFHVFPSAITSPSRARREKIHIPEAVSRGDRTRGHQHRGPHPRTPGPCALRGLLPRCTARARVLPPCSQLGRASWRVSPFRFGTLFLTARHAAISRQKAVRVCPTWSKSVSHYRTLCRTAVECA